MQIFLYAASAMPVPKQPIPHLGFRLHKLLGPGLCFIFVAWTILARASEPPRRIPLDPLGFQPLSSQFLLAGSSMLTIDYVDDTHMLVTFNVRRLMRRLTDDPPDDQDRNVDALLLDLSTGRILARTSWRLHDHGQYLWNIGHGRFLLRVRDTITTFSPLTHLATGEPFREHPFLNTDNRRIAEIMISPDDRLLTIETVKRNPPAPHPKTPLFGLASPPPPEPSSSVQINFYRIPNPGDTGESPRPSYAGVILANGAGTIPTLSAGYIDVIDQGKSEWAFDFDAYSGKKIELAPFDSTCRPAPFFVSRSEFIAFGCHTGTSRQVLGGFNMRGEQTWQQNLFGDYIAPSLAFAPARDRFAIGRILVHQAVTPDQSVVPEEMGAQSIVVYQASSGKQLLHAECSPVEPAGQNFTLAPDGLSLAIVRNGAIEIYSLPELTTKESADLKLAESSVPEDSDLPVHFSAEQQSLAMSDANSETESNSAQSSTPTENSSPAVVPPEVGTSASVNADSATPGPTAGDPAPNQPRPRPTLYTLPSDPLHSPKDEKPQDEKPQ